MNETTKALSSVSNELSVIFENAAVVLMPVDDNAKVLNINKSGLELTGKELDKVIGRLGGEVFSCVNSVTNGQVTCGKLEVCKSCSVRGRITSTVKEGNQHYKEEGSLIVKDKEGKATKLDLLISTSDINVDEKRYILLTIDDITKAKEQEKELAKLNEDKDKFISILSHDLRSPYNSFIGFTEILINNWQSLPPDKVNKILGTLNSVAKNSYELLDDLLSWAKSQSGKAQFEPNTLIIKDLCKKIRSVVQHSAELKNIEIKHIGEDDTSIYADPKMLSTVLRNLLSNAIKFSPDNSIITVSSRSDDMASTIIVEDQGVGVPKDKIDALFDITHFHSTSGTNGEKGSGLGLILCKEFIDKHKGTIRVESEEGKGSKFIITLPHKR